MEKFVLIDGNSLINRGFYATPPMSSSKGVPTNAVYAFCNMLLKIIKDIEPKYILVAFDRKEPTFRHLLYDSYKGTRKPSPDDLRSQITLLKRVLDSLNVARFELAGFEADDIIGTIAKRFSNLHSIIITGDKDSFQLVDETTEVFFTKRGITDIEVYNSDNFVEKVGIDPINVIDLKSLMGDSSDNIPGVKGVGEKTALNLVKTYKTTENIYANIDKITGALKTKLENDFDGATLSKKLATIDVNVPCQLTLEDCEFDFPFKASAKEIFLELELRNLLKKEEIFVRETEAKSLSCEDVSFKEIDQLFDFTSIVKNSIISVYIGDNISFYDSHKKCEYQLKIKENFFDQGFEFDEAITFLKPLFSNQDVKLVVYYKNQLRHLLGKFNVEITAYCEDVSIMKYLVDFSGKDDKLEDVFVDKGLNKNTPSYSLFVLYEEYLKLLVGDEKKLFYEVEMPLCDVLYSMEKAGFKIDFEALNKTSSELKGKLADLNSQIIKLAGCEFNVNSPKQLGEVLFDKLNLKHGKTNKNGYSTNAEILESLVDEHPIVPLIIKFRQLSKLNSTYVEGYKNLIDKQTGLVHTTFNQVQTATGRLSSREPNLQNIPVRDEEGKEIRKLFSARDDEHVLIDADYSQIELRLLAHFSKSQQLIDAFRNGIDVHKVTASQVFGVSLDKVTKEMRSQAKAVNFGIIYGISEFGLAKNLKIGVKQASEYINKYFEMYPNVKEYMQNNVDFAKKNGYAVTLLGRKRYIREINSSNYNLRTFGERVAMNMPLQGTSADIIKIAMNNVFRRLNENKLQSKLILQVHDELIIDALKSEKEVVKQILVEEMENAVNLDVPLDVEVSVCENWYDAK